MLFAAAADSNGDDHNKKNSGICVPAVQVVNRNVQQALWYLSVLRQSNTNICLYIFIYTLKLIEVNLFTSLPLPLQTVKLFGVEVWQKQSIDSKFSPCVRVDHAGAPICIVRTRRSRRDLQQSSRETSD